MNRVRRTSRKDNESVEQNSDTDTNSDGDAQDRSLEGDNRQGAGTEEDAAQPMSAELDQQAGGDTDGPLLYRDVSEEQSAASEESDATPEAQLASVSDQVVAEDEVSSQATLDQQAGSQNETETTPLSQVQVPEREDLTPLPVNAVVDGRYLIQSQLHHSIERNLYRITARRQQLCPQCGRLSSVDAETCEQCGATLAGLSPAEFYLMAESYRPDALIQDPGLMELNLYHPNLVPVIDFFSYKPFGRMRYYAVAEPRQGVRLGQLSLPRPPAQVLSWAMQLADALNYLHNRGVIGAGAEADDILVQGDRASLASLQNARASAEDDNERIQQQSIDLARLATTIYEAYTGNSSSLSPEGIITMPAGVPEQVRSAFRAAIEPVQGTSPPITVAHWRNMLAKALEAVDELERPGRPVSFVSVGLTDVGRLRDLNEDSFGMAEFVQASQERPSRIGLYVVADGLGGHKGGELASALAVQAFCGEIVGRVLAPLVLGSSERSAPSNEAILQGMTRAVQTANDRIYKARDNRQNDMGTTVVAVLVTGGKAYIVNVGDSRLYLYASEHREDETVSIDATRPLVKGTSPLASLMPLQQLGSSGVQSQNTGELGNLDDYSLTQVSVDHSLVHRLVELGQLDPEEAKVHPHRNFIYRSLGGPPPIEVDTFVRTLHPGDRLLLCSDGLNTMLEDNEIEEVLASERDPHVACRRLIDLANEAGGHDNITVLLIDIQDYLPLTEHAQ